METTAHITSVSPGSRKGDSASMGLAAESHAVSKRLQSELMSLMASSEPGISAFPDGDSLFSWLGTIQGAAGTVYESLSYKLQLKFSAGTLFRKGNNSAYFHSPNEEFLRSVILNYPFKAPEVKFLTPCYHPNIDQYGNICLDVLKEKWSAAFSVRTVLLSIQSLLGEPNNDSPLNQHAARLWQNQEEYKKVLLKKYMEAQKS